MFKSKHLSSSNTSLASIKNPDNVVTEVTELAKKFDIKRTVKEVCDKLSNKTPVLDALKILDSARPLSDQTKELCKNLEDINIICKFAIKIINKGHKDTSKVEAAEVVLAYLDFFEKIPSDIYEILNVKVKQKIQGLKKEIVQKENDIEQKEQMQKLQESMKEVVQKEDKIQESIDDTKEYITQLEPKSPTLSSHTRSESSIFSEAPEESRPSSASSVEAMGESPTAPM